MWDGAEVLYEIWSLLLCKPVAMKDSHLAAANIIVTTLTREYNLLVWVSASVYEFGLAPLLQLFQDMSYCILEYQGPLLLHPVFYCYRVHPLRHVIFYCFRVHTLRHVVFYCFRVHTLCCVVFYCFRVHSSWVVSDTVRFTGSCCGSMLVSLRI